MTLKTLEEVRAAVEVIRVQAGDPECAHGEEDELWETVLRAIADGSCPDPTAWAAEALKTKDIAFARWYA